MYFYVYFYMFTQEPVQTTMHYFFMLDVTRLVLYLCIWGIYNEYRVVREINIIHVINFEPFLT